MSKIKPEIKIFDTPELLVVGIYNQFRGLFSSEPQRARAMHIALAGGSTPRAFYEFLSVRPSDEIDWRQIHLWWGDERCVPPDHAESNYRMVKEALLDHIRISPEQIHRMQGEAIPQTEMIRYAKEIRSNLPLSQSGLPVFDMILLGMGEDGHTASIFPGSELRDDTDAWCAVVQHPQSGQKRVTLTLPVLNQARQIVFMISGSAKSGMVSEILNHPEQSKKYPAAKVLPQNGILTWFLDREAAAYLK